MRQSVVSNGTLVTSAKRGLSFILTCMPTKLKTEIIAAAIAGFEEQKKRLNVQIAELRQMLNPSGGDGTAPTPKRRRMSAAARARIAAAQRKRWAASREQAGAAPSSAPPQEAETERRRTKGDHRGHEAALGGIPKGARPLSGSAFSATIFSIIR